MLVDNREKRTAYYESKAGQSDTTAVKSDWAKLWKVQLPSKLRLFLWRLAHQSIPTEDVRHHRNMATTNFCSMCGQPDSWRHSLLECNLAKPVWALERESIIELLSQIQEPSARAWLAAVVKGLTQEELTRVAVRLWAVWHAKRKAIHEQEFHNPLSTHCFRERFLSELQPLTSTPTSSLSGTSRQPRWIPPPAGLMKINTDAAVSKNSKLATAAAVARDGEGNFVGASVLVLEGITNAEVAEVMACREGLALAADLGLHKIRLASDCANAIRSIAGAVDPL